MAHGITNNARLPLLLGVAIFCLVTLTEPTLGFKYIVGDQAGWTFGVEHWPEKHLYFKTGDMLVFRYNKNEHNVVEVSEEDYNSCTASSGAKVHQSGRDIIGLSKGKSFYICSFPGHCDRGMKIAINTLV